MTCGCVGHLSCRCCIEPLCAKNSDFLTFTCQLPLLSWVPALLRKSGGLRLFTSETDMLEKVYDLCVCACMRVHVCFCVFVRVHACLSFSVCACMCMCASACVCMCACACVCVYWSEWIELSGLTNQRTGGVCHDTAVCTRGKAGGHADPELTSHSPPLCSQDLVTAVLPR